MLKKGLGLVFLMLLGLLTTLPVSAHTPMLYVEDYMDGTVYLEGGFSDGSSAAGVEIMLVEDQDFSNDTAIRDQYLAKVFKDQPEDRNTYLAFVTGQDKDAVKGLEFSDLKAELYQGKADQSVADLYWW